MRDKHPDDETVAGEWVWPLGVWRGRKPEISDGFASKRRSPKGELIRHCGVDLMYRRVAADTHPPGTPNGSRGYIVPDHRAALAAADGVASFAKNMPRGWTAILDHVPRKFSTYYTHLGAFMFGAERGGVFMFGARHRGRSTSSLDRRQFLRRQQLR